MFVQILHKPTDTVVLKVGNTSPILQKQLTELCSVLQTSAHEPKCERMDSKLLSFLSVGDLIVIVFDDSQHTSDLL